jgi:hypothetical protein
MRATSPVSGFAHRSFNCGPISKGVHAIAISPLIDRQGPGKKANLTRIKPLYASRGLPHQPCCHYRDHVRCVMQAALDKSGLSRPAEKGGGLPLSSDRIPSFSPIKALRCSLAPRVPLLAEWPQGQPVTAALRWDPSGLGQSRPKGPENDDVESQSLYPRRQRRF